MSWAHEEVSSILTIPTALGGVTEAHRSDTAGATVQLRPERFHKEQVLEQDLPNKRAHFLVRGRGVTAAQRAFNSRGGGSNPSGPIDRHEIQACSSTVRAGSL